MNYKCSSLYAILFYWEKDEKPFMRLVWLGVKNPLHTDRCWHGSVYHNNGLWQLEINRHLQIWRRNLSQLNCLRGDKLPRALYRFVFKPPDFFYLEDFVGGIGIMLLEFRLLSSPDIFWNYASWSQREESRGLYCLHLHLHLTLSLWKFQNHVCSPAISCD